MSGLPNCSDHSLLQKWREGSQEAAWALYERYRPRLQALVRGQLSQDVWGRLDAEDLVQSIFCRFFLSVTEKEYHVPEGEELWGLFVVIAMNRIRTEESFQRAHRRDVRRTIYLEMASLATGESGPQSEETSQLLQLSIDDALNEVPAQQRAIVELRIEGYPIAEIAQRVGRSRRSVERCLQEARRQLRRYLLVEEEA